MGQMSKIDDYRATLRSLTTWDDYLREHSGLPGPRGNIELARAVAEEGDRALFDRFTALTAAVAPVNAPDEFLAFCGVVGRGRLLADGDPGVAAVLRDHAVDVRWRIREAVAMALQRLGDVDMKRMIAGVREWAAGSPLEQRAAAAAVCEPRLLRDRGDARDVLDLLDTITASVPARTDRRDDGFIALRKGLGYCWSVAVAALPDEGKPLLEKWLGSTDPDIRWIMRENLKKKRLERADPGWVALWRSRISR
jgi:hypothetical protein